MQYAKACRSILIKYSRKGKEAIVNIDPSETWLIANGLVRPLQEPPESKAEWLPLDYQKYMHIFIIIDENTIINKNINTENSILNRLFKRKTVEKQKIKPTETEENNATTLTKIQKCKAKYVLLEELMMSMTEIGLEDVKSRISNTCKRIFNQLEQHNEKDRLANKFLNYYIDTLYDILRKYNDLKHSGECCETKKMAESVQQLIIKMSNIFSRQLEQLLETDIMDLEAEIKVLNAVADNEGV